MIPDHKALRAELAELIAIPSVSADPAHAADVEAAATWAAERVRRAGGESDVVSWNGRPLAIGEVRASRSQEVAPTVLCYAHFDVQPPDPLELWESPPFELVERDGWLVGRGIADDKAQLYMLIKAAEVLAGAGELPVNVRFALDGEEEIGGHSIVDWLEQDERGADAAVVLDGGMVRRGVPAFCIALRGLCYFHVTVRTGERDLHSGIAGGAALNALHALEQALAGVLPHDGRLPEALRTGVVPPSSEEIQSWSQLPSGEEQLTLLGATSMDVRAAEEWYVRTWAEPSVDVNGVAGGSPDLIKTVIPVEARANVSMRLVPRQSSAEAAGAFERLLRDAAPVGADLELTVQSRSEPALVDPNAPAVTLGLDAFEAVFGVRPVLTRSGGSIPVAAALGAREIPAIVTGFALDESNAHSPNEKFPVEYLSRGVETIVELYRRLGGLA